MKIIDADILSVQNGYILQNCDCISVIPKGLSALLADKFPGTCPYYFRRNIFGRDLAQWEFRSIPGTLSILQGSSGPGIINIFGQYDPGNPNNLYETFDETHNREKYFEMALEELIDYFSGTSDLVQIAVPYRMGCPDNIDLNWNKYEQMLSTFEEKMKMNNINTELTIYLKLNY